MLGGTKEGFVSTLKTALLEAGGKTHRTKKRRHRYPAAGRVKLDMMDKLFCSTVSALCYSLAPSGCVGGNDRAAVGRNLIVDFVLGQYRAMPDFLRLPIFILTLGFSMGTFFRDGTHFRSLGPERREVHIRLWKLSRLGVRRDLMRFYESMAVLAGQSLADNLAQRA